MSVTYRVSGAGANGGPANRIIMLTVEMKVDNQFPRNSKKTDLQVVVEGPSNVNSVNIMGGDRGKFVVGFTPTAPGVHWVDFIYQGTFAAEAYRLPVSDGPNCPDFPYEGKQRALGAPAQSASVPSTPQKGLSEEEIKRREEEERLKREEEERLRKEEEERLKREEEERLRKEEEERLRKEEEERLRREEEERERLRLEEEARARKEAYENAKQSRFAELASQVSEIPTDQLQLEIEVAIERVRLLYLQQVNRK
eukprot:TRINITY_DN4480_c0_g3_i1.p1 TRINITY_DN4480_c0_g3~~TRINITY_DN4480_c0_g3_i1.p1  ORF type:complete len:254 (-),score=86.24 TRINITY_DN4480_c0_g3_i1:42-803(-)